MQSAFESKEAYYKAIGYQEENGEIESLEDYLRRLESYMRLYAALIQVCHFWALALFIILTVVCITSYDDIIDLIICVL